MNIWTCWRSKVFEIRQMSKVVQHSENILYELSSYHHIGEKIVWKYYQATISIWSPTSSGVKISVSLKGFRICNNICTPFLGLGSYRPVCLKKSPKGGCWECHLKYIGQKCFSYFHSIQQTNRGQMTIVAWYTCHEAILVSWRSLVHCRLSKYLDEFCYTYLRGYSQRPSLEVFYLSPF